jgi:hypothetical protein
MKKPSKRVINLRQWESDYIYRLIVMLFKEINAKRNEAKNL